MPTKKELNEAANAAIQEAQAQKREDVRRFWDETADACDIVQRYRDAQPKEVVIRYGDEEIPEHPAITYMNSREFVVRSHLLTLIEGAITGASLIAIVFTLIAYVVILR